MKRVLVTGATGFIGSRVAHSLKAKGWDVVLIVRSSSAVPEDLSRDV
jgi:nucleoside-diphosphate-sugar epimerase